MDIEGAEWQALLNISEKTLARFRIIVVEMHELERLMDRHSFSIIQAVMDRLLDKFYLVHNHPNNTGGIVAAGKIEIPRVVELTFLRRDRAKRVTPAHVFPHPLDEKNELYWPNIVLPAIWHARPEKQSSAL